MDSRQFAKDQALFAGFGRNKREAEQVPTQDAYAAACKALAHWRKEAKRLGRLAGVRPREMNRK